MDMTQAKKRIQERRCPYCGAGREHLNYGNVEIDGKEVFQVVDCMTCELHFTEVYAFRRVILTDQSGEDFRIDFTNEAG